jgi:hypothetical protein
VAGVRCLLGCQAGSAPLAARGLAAVLARAGPAWRRWSGAHPRRRTLLARWPKQSCAISGDPTHLCMRQRATCNVHFPAVAGRELGCFRRASPPGSPRPQCSQADRQGAARVSCHVGAEGVAGRGRGPLGRSTHAVVHIVDAMQRSVHHHHEPSPPGRKGACVARHDHRTSLSDFLSTMVSGRHR